MSVFKSSRQWFPVLLGLALLAGGVECANADLALRHFNGQMTQTASDASNVSRIQPSRATTEQRQAKSKARLLAGTAMAVLSLLALAVGLALVRAFKR